MCRHQHAHYSLIVLLYSLYPPLNIDVSAPTRTLEPYCITLYPKLNIDVSAPTRTQQPYCITLYPCTIEYRCGEIKSVIKFGVIIIYPHKSLYRRPIEYPVNMEAHYSRYLIYKAQRVDPLEGKP